jgi:guanidinopropionase
VPGTDVTQMQLPRFSGIPTFMRVPLCADPAALDIVLVGVPFDGGVTARPGARFGPREIRNMSTLTRSTHHITRSNPFDVYRIGDIGDVPFTDLYHLERAHEDIRRFFEPIFAAGKIALSAGGDHSITYPIFQALSPKEPIAMVHIDAHTDTWDSFKGSKFTHGAPFRRAVEAGLLDPKRTVQIGIRGAQNSDEG